MVVVLLAEKAYATLTLDAYSATTDVFINVAGAKDVILRIRNGDASNSVDWIVYGWNQNDMTGRVNAIASMPNDADTIQANTAVAATVIDEVQVSNAKCYTHIAVRVKLTVTDATVANATLRAFGRSEF